MPHPNAISYKSRGGRMLYKPTCEMVEPLFHEDTYGWCLVCGEFEEGVEPDATNYHCEGCGENKVFGLGMLAIAGWIV